MANGDPFVRRVRWKRGTSEAAAGKPSLPLPLLGVGAALLIIGGLMVRAATPPPPAPTPTAAPTPVPQVLIATPTAAPSTATPLPVCTPGASYLKVISDQEKRSKWDAAADNAATALDDDDLCEDDRSTLAARYVTDALEGLWARKFGPDKASQEEAAARYQTIKQHALRFGAQFPDSVSIAGRAEQSGKFVLTKIAYDEAIEIGTFHTDDIEQVRSYVSNLHNIGSWWTDDPNNPAFREGLSYLVASHHVAVKFKTGQAEAWGLLKERAGSDESKWPAPAATPLLP